MSSGSLTERLIAEITENPELADKLKKLIENVTLTEISRELKIYRQDIQRLSEEQTRLAQEQVKLREDFNKLYQEQVKLREDFQKLSEEQTRLAQEQVKLREDFQKLSEEQTRLAQEQVKLREDFNKLLNEVKELKLSYKRLDKKVDRMFGAMLKGFTDLSQFAGMTFEEFVRRFLENYLKDMKILPKDKSLTSTIIEGEEIDVFSEDPPIIGEVTSFTQSTDEINKILRKAEVFRRKYGKEPAKYLIIMTTRKKTYRELEEMAKKWNINLIVGKISG
ncbi:hypothetical protein HS7_02040 [Sulfolobales archaeon HS-7]|nr:hypothetical protein HS7_02040 [Sulfolobales archaeon HS-7]